MGKDDNEQTWGILAPEVGKRGSLRLDPHLKIPPDDARVRRDGQEALRGGTTIPEKRTAKGRGKSGGPKFGEEPSRPASRTRKKKKKKRRAQSREGTDETIKHIGAKTRRAENAPFIPHEGGGKE